MRKARGLTQDALADAVGVPQSSISYYEHSERQIDADDLPRFAAVLGYHPCDFFEEALPSVGPIPARVTQSFEFAGAENMLGTYLTLEDLTDRDAAIVADLIASLKRNRVPPSP